jgi:uncharacterized cofD-like protein
MTRVVSLGGGHGLAVALRALREYADDITAIVGVADDGGSSGRLRRDLDVPAPGDLRRCLVALAQDADDVWARAFEHRFPSGELAGHALGNLVLVGLAETLGGMDAALHEAGTLLRATGTVFPATVDPVSMTARVGGHRVVGQVAVAEAGRSARIEEVKLDPADAPAPTAALDAIARADQIVLAPGSLYTSIVAVMCVPQIREAIAEAKGMVVQVANLATENETTGHDGTDHLRAVREHGGRVDVLLYDPNAGLAVDVDAVQDGGTRAVPAPIANAEGSGHDPLQLAKALANLT